MEFTVKVKALPTAAVGFKTLSAQFGDGYEQMAADGINSRKESWSVSVIGALAGRVGEAKMFFDALDGYKSFDWTTPMGDHKKFILRGGYSMAQEGINVFSISAVFEEIHHPHIQ